MEPLTPRGKGTGEGRPVLKNEGPILMTPAGEFVDISGLQESLEITSAEKKEEPSLTEQVDAIPTARSDSGQMPPGWELRTLFGGAIECSLPSSFEDISVVRVVPDHQEVYVDKVSEMSLIVELLQYEESVSDDKAALHYFNDLSQCNEAEEISVESTEVITDDSFMPYIPRNYAKCALVGRQIVAKFNSKSQNRAKDAVQILLLVVRIDAFKTDLLVSLNVPFAQITAAEKSVTSDTLLHTPIVSFESISPADMMKMALHSFRIVDWSLFG